MRAFGIIAEYNPFHTGHRWQLEELRRRFGDDAAVVCAMSGNYVQRGDFAIVRKHVRAEAAVRGGADLVLELPLPWATASAEGFARGGVEVLGATGVVDTLAFGSECADAEKLDELASALLSKEFAELLRGELAAGDSYAAARERAARILCGEDAAALREPNNILGVEYCKALRRMNSLIRPLALPRMGAAHDGDTAADGYASASYIRELICEEDEDGSPDLPDSLLTPDMLRLLERERAAGRAPVRSETVERAILAKLRTMTEDEFADFDEGAEGLYHRFYDASRRASGVGELLDSVKTKRYAYARLRRMLLSMYLGVKPEDRMTGVPYLRVLAMNGRGKRLLHEMRTAAKLPVLVKPADVRELSPAAQRLMDWEARAADLYALAYPNLAQSEGGAEWRTDPVIVDEDG